MSGLHFCYWYKINVLFFLFDISIKFMQVQYHGVNTIVVLF